MTSLGKMEYLPPAQPQLQPQAQDGALKYSGSVASGYDAKRQAAAKWTVEQRIIEDMLADLPPGSWIFDGPCGTGRWLDICKEKQFIYRGVDISRDMLDQAAAKLDNKSSMFRFTMPDGDVVETPQFAFNEGTVLKLDNVPDKSVDCCLNIRMTRWLSPDECQQMFREMQRISRDRIILTARVCNHQHARPLALFEAAMSPEWALARSECGASGPAEAPVEDQNYKIFMFQRRQAVAQQSKPDGDSWVMPPYEAG